MYPVLSIDFTTPSAFVGVILNCPPDAVVSSPDSIVLLIIEA